MPFVHFVHSTTVSLTDRSVKSIFCNNLILGSELWGEITTTIAQIPSFSCSYHTCPKNLQITVKVQMFHIICSFKLYAPVKLWLNQNFISTARHTKRLAAISSFSLLNYVKLNPLLGFLHIFSLDIFHFSYQLDCFLDISLSPRWQPSAHPAEWTNDLGCENEMHILVSSDISLVDLHKYEWYVLVEEAITQNMVLTSEN